MSMNAVPPRVTAAQLGIDENQACPACGTQDTTRSRRWVRCPMLGHSAICYGCCLDLQDLARAPDFDSDPFRDLFDRLASDTGREVRELRQLCLGHQQELISVQLSSSASSEEQDALIALAARVSAAAREVSSER